MMAIFAQWKLILLVTGILLVTALSMRLQTVTAQRNLAVQELASYKKAAEDAAALAKDQSDHALKETKRDYELQKAAIEKTAWANAKARFSTCNAANGIRLDGLRPGDALHNGETGSASATDAAPEESVAVGRSFVESCASDAGAILLWQQWAVNNKLEIAK